MKSLVVLMTAFTLAICPTAFAEPATSFVYTPLPTDVVFGKDNAPVTIVEYASLSCPHCSHFFIHVLPELQKKYIDNGKVKLVFRDFPLNAPALKAAELVHCADKDQQHAYIKVLFTTQQNWVFDPHYVDALGNIATMGGMDRERFDACMKDKDVEKSVIDVAKQGEKEYKISSTPTFFIAGKEEEGDHGLDSMSKAIDGALFKATGK